MRISPSKVVQLVDGDGPENDRLVFIDDDSGAEITVGRESWPLLQYALTYLTGDQNGVRLGMHQHEYQRVQLGVDGEGSPVEIPRCDCGSVGGFITSLHTHDSTCGAECAR